MSDYTVLGMPLDFKDEPGYTVSPLSALVITKGIDSDGDEVYSLMHTGGLTEVESLGMLDFGRMHVEDQLRRAIYLMYADDTDSAPAEE